VPYVTENSNELDEYLGPFQGTEAMGEEDLCRMFGDFKETLGEIPATTGDTSSSYAYQPG